LQSRQRFRLSIQLAGFSGLVAAATLAAIVALDLTAEPGEYQDPVILPVLTGGCLLSGLGFGLAALAEYGALSADPPWRHRVQVGLVISYGLLAVGLFLYVVALHTA
jgi:hypothetical protein